jgi:hypothetical protein
MRSTMQHERDIDRTASPRVAGWFLIAMAASVAVGLLVGIVWLLIGLWQSGRLV